MGAAGAEVTVTTEKLYTLYVIAKTGTNANHRVILQVSPDNGTTWIDTSCEVIGAGACASLSAVCTKVRAKVSEVEGATSTITAWVLAS